MTPLELHLTNELRKHKVSQPVAQMLVVDPYRVTFRSYDSAVPRVERRADSYADAKAIVAEMFAGPCRFDFAWIENIAARGVRVRRKAVAT